MGWRTKVAAIAAAAASLLSLSALAQTLYVATGSGGAPGTLFTVNPTTAATTPVGPVLVGALPVSITGLAFHPTTGVLYALTGGASPNFARHLITINPASGAATDIGALGTAGADMSFTAGGILYITSGNSTSIFTVNLATGAATLVGPTGMPNLQGDAFAINPAGTAFLSNQNIPGGVLSTVNLATGAATPGPAITAVPVAGALNAMAFSPAGVLFAVDTNQGGPASTNNLVTVSTATGVAANIGALPANTDAIAFGPALAVAVAGPVPTLGEWALALLAMLLALAGTTAIARRRDP